MNPLASTAPEHLQQLVALLKTKYPKLDHALDSPAPGVWNIKTTDPKAGNSLISSVARPIPEEGQLKWARSHIKSFRTPIGSK